MTSDSCQLAFSIEGGDRGKTMKIQIALFILNYYHGTDPVRNRSTKNVPGTPNKLTAIVDGNTHTLIFFCCSS